MSVRKKSRSNVKTTPARKQKKKIDAAKKRVKELTSPTGPITKVGLNLTWPTGSKEKQADERKKARELLKERDAKKKQIADSKKKKVATKKKASLAQKARRKKK